MTECPSQQLWQAVLEQRLPAADEEVMSLHAEGCPSCQQVLETLTRASALALVRQVRETHDSRALRQTPPLPRFAARVDRSFTALGLPASAERDRLPVLPGYEMLAELGSGGMGVVFKARHLELNRVVALKMLRQHDLADAGLLARFRDEARAVARLQHPGIVQIHEIGTLEGQPYLALEYVPGPSLDRVLHGMPQPPRDAAALLLPLAEAIHAAHEQGVIHRDLKPANILLQQLATDEHRLTQIERREKIQSDSSICVHPCSSVANSVPKITDFGLAKPLDEDTGRTETGVVVGTPCYMAPEQAAGQKQLGPAVDVYALGAILYEMLTGRPPFKGVTAHDTVHQVLTEEPVPPRRLQSAIPRDLETICLKCLHKEPARRYATAQDLADDLRRFVEGRPILARPATRVERVVKWCRRYPAVAALLVVVTLAAVAASSLAAWAMTAAEAERQAKLDAQQQKEKAVAAAAAEKLAKERTQRERDAKELQRKYAQTIADFVQNDFLALTSLEGQDRFGGDGKDLLSKDTTLRQLLDRAAGKLRQRRDLDPRTEADLCWMIGVNYRGVGENEQAVIFLERCLSLRRQVLGPDHKATLDAGNSLAVAYRVAGKLPEAIALGEQVRDAKVKQLGADHPDTLVILSNLAETYRTAGKLREAVALYEQVKGAVVQKLGTDHHQTFVTLSGLAAAYRAVGKLPEAIALYEQVYNAEAQRLGADHPSTLVTLNNLAGVYLDSRKLPKATALFKQAYDAEVQKLGADHPNTLTTLHNLALAYQLTGKLPQAIALYEQVRDGQVQKLGADHPDTLANLHQLAEAYRVVRKLPEAIALFEQVKRAQVRKLGADHPQTLATVNNLALAYYAVGKLPEAIALLEQVKGATMKKLGADHPDTLATLSNLGQAYRTAGKLSAALPLLEQAATGLEKRRFQDVSAARIIPSTIRTYEDAKQFDQAERWRRKWLMVVQRQAGAESPAYADELAGLGRNLLHQKKWTEAESTLRASLALRTKSQPEAWTTLNTQSLLGAALLGQQNYTDAEPLLLASYAGLKQRAEKIPEQIRTVRLTEALERLVQLYEATGKKAEAAKWQKERETMPTGKGEPAKK